MAEDFANLRATEHDTAARQHYVTRLFDDLAPAYDRFNRVVSFRRDERWRARTGALLGECARGVVLDLAAGTGDLAHSLRRAGARQVHVFDISSRMLVLARQKLLTPNSNGATLLFTRGSAHRLPFEDASLDGVVSGFAMRNVFHFLDEVLQEIRRVLKPGGRFAILELSQPGNPLFRLGFRIHLQTIMPLVGRLTTGQASPFGYLRGTALTFLPPAVFQQRLQQAGFSDVQWETYLLGGIAIHHGTRASD